MRSPSGHFGRRSGFTVAEILIATACLGAVGIVMYALLNVGMTLFAKNVAVNMAHQEARYGINRVVRDLHHSISIPQLVDINLNQNNTVGPSAGVTFQMICNGPFEVMNDPSSGLIQVATTRPKPVPPEVGDHMVVLDYGVETEITKILELGGGANHWNIWLAGEKEKKIQTKSGSFVICYITRRVGYVVNNGQLRFYPNLIATPSTYYVISRNLTSATPFSIPLNDSGAPDTRYTNVDITVKDPTYSNRGFKSTGMKVVDAHIPYRCQITKYQ
jgi:hypothetical protein